MKKVYSREIKLVGKDGSVILQGESYFLEQHLMALLTVKNRSMVLTSGVYSLTLGTTKLIDINDEDD